MLNAQVCASARNSDGKYIGWTCKMGKHMEKWGPSIKASFARQNHHFGTSNFAPVNKKTWTKLRCCYTAMWLKILAETWIIIWMWVKMEDLGDHRCESSLVLTIQLLGYLILTHTHFKIRQKFCHLFFAIAVVTQSGPQTSAVRWIQDCSTRLHGQKGDTVLTTATSPKGGQPDFSEHRVYIYIWSRPPSLHPPPHGLGPQVAAPLPFYLQAIGSISEVQLRIC